jgi:glucokinase
MFTIAIDLGGTIIKTGLLDGLNLVASASVEATRDGSEQNLSAIEKLIDDMLRENNIANGEILGVGFSFPGLVDSTSHRVLSTNKKYDDAIFLDLPQWARSRWDLPLFLENDARAALLGEWQYGAGRGYENIVMVTLGTGIGSAVLMEGRLLKGKHFQAGNLGGHFTINHRGTLCTCGNRGCMEAEASSWRLPELIRTHPQYMSSSLHEADALHYKTLFRHASADDKVAKDVLDHCFSAWSSGLISMIHAFDPEIVILGGGIMENADLILPELQNRIDRHAWTPWGKVKLVGARFINSAALYGADFMVRSALNFNVATKLETR